MSFKPPPLLMRPPPWASTAELRRRLSDMERVRELLQDELESHEAANAGRALEAVERMERRARAELACRERDLRGRR